MLNFAAIDFETANECPSSVCSIGIVVVRDGEIVDEFYSLIHPEPEYYQWFCKRVHGLAASRRQFGPALPDHQLQTGGGAESHHEEIGYIVHCLYPFHIREVQHVPGKVNNRGENEGVILPFPVDHFQMAEIRRAEIT